MIRKTRRAKVGDIIAIPIDSQRYAFVQLIEGNVVGCYIVFDFLSEKYPTLDEIVGNSILFLAFTNDRLISDGYWSIIGNTKTPEGVVIPEFKVDFMENGIIKCMVTRYDGSIIRTATEAECKSLKTMKSITPNVLEDAIKAKFGLIPWQPNFDQLLYKCCK